MNKYVLFLVISFSALIGAGIAWDASRRWPAVLLPSDPTIYTLQFGVTVNKFLVIDNRLHLLVPLPVTGESGQVIEIDKMSKTARRGK